MQNNRHEENEKLAAAYALNMCTVSVSQIVDYNDMYILEQEYDAILNNLNLKNIPKDKALLDILSELLNTITYFRIMEIKKQQIEKEYQQKMKDAIWSAIPSLSIFVSGNPLTMALSLATTVGTGYMNYRKEKAQTVSEKEKAETELQITAIEQFNALKRELFTTAWRLAEEYDFDDSLRLTERQIKQYNEILMDQDEYRKYSRLNSIKDKFKAYPPFWYFFGHSANLLAQNEQNSEMRNQYIKKAKEHFEYYEKLNTYTILREDQMAASFALEYIDLLLLDINCDKDKVKKLLNIAIDNAGNSNDILQLCAMTCLRTDNKDEAKRILRILVDEDYNKTVNAQILSAIYVGEKNNFEYNILKNRVSPRYLYPMPEGGENIGILNKKFEENQKGVLKEKFKKALQNVINKYSEELNKKLSIFDMDNYYDNEFFQNTKKAKRMRINSARMILNDDIKAQNYLERIQEVSLPLEYTLLLEEMFAGIFRTNCFCNSMLKAEAVNSAKKLIAEKKEKINVIQQKIDDGIFSIREYEELQKIGVIGFVNEAFEIIYRDAVRQIEQTCVDDLFVIESSIMQLCNDINVSMPEIAIDEEYSENDFILDDNLFDISLFGSGAIVAMNNYEYIKQMVTFIKDKMNKINCSESEVQIWYRDDTNFDRYFYNEIFKEYTSLKQNSLMVIKDLTKDKFDLIFTTEGIVNVKKNKVKKKTPYNEVKFVKDKLELYDSKYKGQGIDIAALYEMIQSIDRMFINNVEKITEYFDGTVEVKQLNDWFRNNKNAMLDTIERVYAMPSTRILEHMGYYMEKELDNEHYLLQFYYEKTSGTILGLRVVEFESLDSQFQKVLTDGNGIIKIEK